jgi:hypothetical protein
MKPLPDELRSQLLAESVPVDEAAPATISYRHPAR